MWLAESIQHIAHITFDHGLNTFKLFSLIEIFPPRMSFNIDHLRRKRVSEEEVSFALQYLNLIYIYIWVPCSLKRDMQAKCEEELIYERKYCRHFMLDLLPNGIFFMHIAQRIYEGWFLLIIFESILRIFTFHFVK